jgi:hypothetical protein
LRLLPVLVFLSVAGAVVAAFFLTRNVVADQERRILRDRTAEIAQLLTGALADLSASLRPVAVASRLGGRPHSCRRRVRSAARSVREPSRSSVATAGRSGSWSRSGQGCGAGRR